MGTRNVSDVGQPPDMEADGATPSLRPAHEPRRLGVSTGAFYPHLATEEVPAAAARLGLRDLEIMLQTAGEHDPAFVHRLRATCDATGCRVHAVHTWSEFHPLLSPYPRRVAEGRALFDRAIDAAVTLSAQALVWHGPKREEVGNPGGWERFVEAAAEVGVACGSAGITLALENVGRRALRTVRDVAAFAACLPAFDPAARVGFAFDPFQAIEAAVNPFMILAAMGDRVVDVHLSDGRQGDAVARHLLPGDGDLPWPALLRAVAVSGYAGPLILEAALDREGAALERIRQHLDPILHGLSTVGGSGRIRDIAGDRCAGPLPPGVLAGIALFNARRFYDCHEEIEHEWHAERGEIRRLYQGILQIGVGFHHALRGNHRGAILLLTDGIAKTARFLPHCRGIDTSRLATETQACLDRISALRPAALASFDPDTIPLVHLVDERSGQSDQAPGRQPHEEPSKGR